MTAEKIIGEVTESGRDEEGDVVENLYFIGDEQGTSINYKIALFALYSLFAL
jgi:hypothetical protein